MRRSAANTLSQKLRLETAKIPNFNRGVEKDKMLYNSMLLIGAELAVAVG